MFELSRTLKLAALSLSCVMCITGCDKQKPSATTESAPVAEQSANNTPAQPATQEAAKEAPQEAFCATLLTTFTPKDNQYYYVIVDPCVKLDGDYNKNIDPYLKAFRAEIAKTPGFDPSANVSLMPRVVNSKEELQTAISNIKGTPKELKLEIER